MKFGKITTPYSGLVRVLLVVLSFLGLQQAAQAQTDDLMIVEYVDWNTGSGMAVKIYNPTPAVVNLNGYSIKVFDNGDPATPNTPQYVVPLSGNLLPCEVKIIGNNAYCNTNCKSGGCDFSTTTLQGVNGNDPVVLMKNGLVVDAIGRIGFTSISNGNSQRIGTTNNALFERRITRSPGNVSRYSLSTGTYDPNNQTTANIWPNNTTTSVTGWTVASASCISNTWSSPAVTVNAGVDLIIPCFLPGAVVSLNGTASAGSTVEWSGGNGTFANKNSSVTTYTISATDVSPIRLQLTATSGCRRQTDEVVISFSSSAVLTLDPGANKNFNCPQDSILLTASVTGGSFLGWSGGKGTFRDKNAASTYYFPAEQDFYKLVLKATAGSACSAPQEKFITIINGDSTEITSGFDYSPLMPMVNEAVTFTLSNKTPDKTSGTWNFGDGTTSAKITGPVQHKYTKPGIYTVSLRAENRFGCVDTLSKFIIVAEDLDIIIPNIFTPNNDDQNDTFSPQMPATSAYRLQVFNRWGSRVFESNDRDKEWDGKGLSDGVYFVYLEVTYLTGETKAYKVPVTIVR